MSFTGLFTGQEALKTGIGGQMSRLWKTLCVSENSVVKIPTKSPAEAGLAT
jgi:hypothetical protein